MSDLKATLDTIADSVTLNPGAAGVTFKAGNDLVGTCEVDVRVRDHMVKVDEPTSLGGGDAGPNPVEFALAALGSCWAITYRFWSAKLGIPIDKVTIDVEGDLDVRGVFGIDDNVRPGYGEVRVQIHLSGPEPRERYEELAAAVDEHCPVLDIFANPTPVKSTLTIA